LRLVQRPVRLFDAAVQHLRVAAWADRDQPAADRELPATWKRSAPLTMIASNGASASRQTIADKRLDVVAAGSGSAPDRRAGDYLQADDSPRVRPLPPGTATRADFEDLVGRPRSRRSVDGDDIAVIVWLAIASGRFS
jgi:hypothetical protein